MKFAIEHVKWIDSLTQSGWQLLPIPDEALCHLCESVGFVVAETDRGLRLSCSMGDIGGSDEQVSGLVEIPKAAIISRKVLIKAK